MSQMRDEQRLEVLKEVGGTRVYEERRRDSLRIMQETESRRLQIQETVGDPLLPAGVRFCTALVS